VDHARAESLGDLVRALLPQYPELEVHTDVQRVLDVPHGSTLILVPRVSDADWLNINRPVFAHRALRVVLFCDTETAIALARQAVDFFDWISHRVECPSRPPRYAVAGLRCALAARAPGIVWTGGDLEASFAAARPHRELHKASAAQPYAQTLAEVREHPRTWIAWSDIDGGFRLRRVRWALAETRRRTRAILINPAVSSPGWWTAHGRVAAPGEARAQLEKAGAHFPGRLAALVDLEPEVIELIAKLLEKGFNTSSLETSCTQALDPGAIIGQMAHNCGLTSTKQVIHNEAPPPVMRAAQSGLLEGISRLRFEELEDIAQRLKEGERVEASDLAWWTVNVNIRNALVQIPPTAVTHVAHHLIEAILWAHLSSSETWSAIGVLATVAGDMDAAAFWARLSLDAVASEAAPEGALASLEKVPREQHHAYGQSLQVLATALAAQARYGESERLLRQAMALEDYSDELASLTPANARLSLAVLLRTQGRLTQAEQLLRDSIASSEKTLGPEHPGHARLLLELAAVLNRQSKFQEAEALARQSAHVLEKTLAPGHPAYAVSLNVLTATLTAQGRYSEAEDMSKRALTTVEQSFGTEHPAYGDALHEAATIRLMQGRYAEAEELLRTTLSIKEQAHSQNSSTLCPTLANLGATLLMRGNASSGEQLLKRALNIAQSTIDSSDPMHAQISALLAVAQDKAGHIEAQETARRALKTLMDTLGPDHPTTHQFTPRLEAILAKQPEPTT
jgi:tetratricopeptide (TPR) repeat protein